MLSTALGFWVPGRALALQEHPARTHWGQYPRKVPTAVATVFALSPSGSVCEVGGRKGLSYFPMSVVRTKEESNNMSRFLLLETGHDGARALPQLCNLQLAPQSPPQKG